MSIEPLAAIQVSRPPALPVRSEFQNLPESSKSIGNSVQLHDPQICKSVGEHQSASPSLPLDKVK